MVAPEMSDNEEARSHNDHVHMVHRTHHHDTLGDILRSSGDIQRRTRRPAVHRGVAGSVKRGAVFSHR